MNGSIHSVLLGGDELVTESSKLLDSVFWSRGKRSHG